MSLEMIEQINWHLMQWTLFTWCTISICEKYTQTWLWKLGKEEKNSISIQCGCAYFVSWEINLFKQDCQWWIRVCKVHMQQKSHAIPMQAETKYSSKQAAFRMRNLYKVYSIQLSSFNVNNFKMWKIQNTNNCARKKISSMKEMQNRNKQKMKVFCT